MRKVFFFLELMLLPMVANAYDFEVDGIFYNINGDEVTVTYADTYYNSYSGNVIIPENVSYGGAMFIVSAIGDRAFQNCKNLTHIDIPNSVISIGRFAFYKCTGLTYIEIPDYVTSIGEHAFSECRGLKSLVYPCLVTSIEGYAFSNCFGLRILEIPSMVTKLGSLAFYNPRFQTLMVSGEGEWQGNGIGVIDSDPIPCCLYIDKRITSIKGLENTTNNDVYCFATTPPSCDDKSFFYYKGTLHVPAASLAAYFTADYWSNFPSIIGDAVEPLSITISNDSINIQIDGGDIALYANVIPENATPNEIIWISTNTAVASVNDNGTVTPMGSGECDIIAQCLNNKAICHVVVNDSIVAITLDQQEAMLLPNHMLILNPGVTPIPILPDLVVTSSDPTVAAARVINNEIQVVGIKEGTTTITVGSVDGTAIPATCLVTVYTEPGDMNCDGFVNISDVTLLISYILGGNNSQISTKNADVNEDGYINISDVTKLISIVLKGNQ